MKTFTMTRQFRVLLTAFLALSSSATFAATVTEKAICPVCRIHEGETEPEIVEASVDYEGHTYGFCSAECRDTFLEAPAAYLPPVLPRPAAPFTAQDLEGADFSLTELRGRVVLLDFWATWCQPCVVDLPKLTQLHERHGDNGLTVISLSIDEGADAAKKISRILEKRKVTHPVYLDSSASPAWATYNVKVVPTQFLIDAQGNVVAQWSGKIDLEVVEAEILRLLAAE